MRKQLPQFVIDMLSTPSRRLHHYLWHLTRNAWVMLSEDQRNAIKNIDSNWEPPRPALNTAREPVLDNNSGEDFLYMHRQMIAHTNIRLAAENNEYGDKIERWEAPPPPEDPNYPMVSYTTGNQELNANIATAKSEDFFNNLLKLLSDRFKDPEYLRSLSLGELGARIEFTVHNWMHMRYSEASSVGYLTLTNDDPTSANFPETWNLPAYNWLGDTYSSHVNSTFWRLHGWVDDCIEHWKQANNVQTINWTGTWTGNMPSPPNTLLNVTSAITDPLERDSVLRFEMLDLDTTTRITLNREHHFENMKLIAKVFKDAGVGYRFYDTFDKSMQMCKEMLAPKTQTSSSGASPQGMFGSTGSSNNRDDDAPAPTTTTASSCN